MLRKSIKTDHNPKVLILEDDADQMHFLAALALGEIAALVDDDNTSDSQREALRSIKVLKIPDIESLEKASLFYKGVIFTILDCHTPYNADSEANDQFVKTGYTITGRHKAVDVVMKRLPNVPITLVSSSHRFQRTVSRYYKNKYDININFISKNEHNVIAKNMAYYLRQHMRQIDAD